MNIEQEARAKAQDAYPAVLPDEAQVTYRRIVLRAGKRRAFASGYVAGASRSMFAPLGSYSVTFNTEDIGEPTDLDGNPIRPTSLATREAVAEVVRGYMPGADGDADSRTIADALLAAFRITDRPADVSS